MQYLYAAYSLGGPQVPEAFRDSVRTWQEVILGIAKEEMGHLISGQNSLRLIGSPLHTEREDEPWDSSFYPFPFTLEPLTLNSLAKYVYAESPVDWDGGVLGDEIRLRVHARGEDPQQVAALFNTLIPLVADPDYLPDAAFDASPLPAQADFAEWGRGYQGGYRARPSGQRPADADAGRVGGAADLLRQHGRRAARHHPPGRGHQRHHRLALRALPAHLCRDARAGRARVADGRTLERRPARTAARHALALPLRRRLLRRVGRW
ncbi:ferritin-like domain-containing protein [Duganella sp. BJB476]|uniref:ferritin-like domain-containing protein n=1 Tax=Duganella sp. BJB476 TaxID=1871176 RepID=UPI0035A69B5B